MIRLVGEHPIARYHDNQTRASDPGDVTLSRARLLRLDPQAASPLCWVKAGWLLQGMVFGWRFLEMLDEHLQVGDSRAAVVQSTEPLLVSAYTDELDCVAILHFPSRLVQEEALEVGSRLLTVNTYLRALFSDDGVARDLQPGPLQYHRYVNFYPVVADFVSEDRHRIARRKVEIAEAEWDRCVQMGRECLQRAPRRWRSGSPLRSHTPTR